MKKITLITFVAMIFVGRAEADLLLSPADQIIGGFLNETGFVEGLASTAGGGTIGRPQNHQKI